MAGWVKEKYMLSRVVFVCVFTACGFLSAQLRLDRVESEILENNGNDNFKKKRKILTSFCGIEDVTFLD